MKAADIPDDAILAAVEAARDGSGEPKVSDVIARFPHAPRKVVWAKLQSMTRRGWLDGCRCGVFRDGGRYCSVYVTGEHATIDRAALTDALRRTLLRERGGPN